MNYTFRMHDPRVGRFFAVDPLTKKYPWNSPYAFSENRVIDGVEFEGLEVTPYKEKTKYKPVFVEGSGNVLQRINNGAYNTLAYVNNITIVPAYNLSSDAINGSYNLITGEYNDTFSYLPTEIDRALNSFSNQVSDFFSDLENYFSSNSSQKVYDDTLISLTNLETYELPGELFIWHKASKLSGSGAGMGATTVAETENLIKVDLMSGPKGRSGFITFDIAEGANISDDVVNFGKYFGKNSIDYLEVNNPMAPFMEYVQESVKSGGTLTIRGQFKNPNFASIWDGQIPEGFKEISRKRGISSEGYTKTNGTPIQGEMNEIQLKKL